MLRACASPAFPETSGQGLILQAWRRRFAVAANRKHPAQLCKPAVRLYRESDPKPVIAQLAWQPNAHGEALQNWIRQDG
jgi:hypothetical protein